MTCLPLHSPQTNHASCYRCLAMMTGSPFQTVRRCDALSSQHLRLVTPCWDPNMQPSKRSAPDFHLTLHAIMGCRMRADSGLAETLPVSCAKSCLAGVTFGVALSRLAETPHLSCSDSGLAGSMLVLSCMQEQIKSLLTGLMLSTPPLARAQLSEALSVVSSHDFPRKWATLLPEDGQCRHRACEPCFPLLL